MGKESRIRQERKRGLVEKPEMYHKDRFPVVMRVIALVLIVALATWGSFFAIKSATGTIAYQVGTGKILQSDITARVQNYVDMYKQYGMDLTTAENASTLKSVRKNAIDNSIEQELFIQYAKSKNMTIDQAKLKTALDTEVENAIAQSQQQFGTDTQGFNDAVIAQYGSMDKFKATLRTQIQPFVERQQLADAVTAEINAGVTVSDADIKTYFGSQGRVNAHHLLITIDTDNDSSSTIAAKKKVAQAICDEAVKQKAENATFDFAKRVLGEIECGIFSLLFYGLVTDGLSDLLFRSDCRRRVIVSVYRDEKMIGVNTSLRAEVGLDIRVRDGDAGIDLGSHRVSKLLPFDKWLNLSAQGGFELVQRAILSYDGVIESLSVRSKLLLWLRDGILNFCVESSLQLGLVDRHVLGLGILDEQLLLDRAVYGVLANGLERAGILCSRQIHSVLLIHIDVVLDARRDIGLEDFPSADLICYRSGGALDCEEGSPCGECYYEYNGNDSHDNGKPVLVICPRLLDESLLAFLSDPAFFSHPVTPRSSLPLWTDDSDNNHRTIP